MALQYWFPLTGSLNNYGLCTVTSSGTTGATVNSSGKIGSCYSFDGTDDNLYWEHDKTIWNNKEITFCCWFKSDCSKSSGTIMEIGADLCLGYTYNSSGVCFSLWRAYKNSSGTRTGDSRSSSTYFTANAWHHISAVFDHQYNKLYVDGSLINTWDSSSLYTTNFTPLLSGYPNLAVGRSYGSTSFIGGLVNDVRYYDNALSDKEIKEISKGLVVHYPLCSQYIESTTNSSPQPYQSSYPSCSPGWDTTKHINAVSVANWGNGYNSGVGNPTTGYHAMWNIIDNIPTIVFQDHNSEISSTHRWMGTCCILNTAITSAITAGMKYTISFDIKAIDNTGGYCTAGLYYRLTSSSSQAFNDGCPSFGTIETVGEWTRLSYTFTRNTSYDGNTTVQYFYIYGHYGTESTKYVRNIQLEIKDHATPYINGSRSETTVYDTSGFGNNGTLSGTVQVVYNSTPRNLTCTNIASATISHPRALLSGTDQEWTCSAWVYPTATTGGQKLNNFNNGNSIYYSTTQPLLYLNSGDNDYYIYGASNCITANAWNHVVFTFRNSDGARKIYVNGVDKSSSGPNKTYTPSGIPSTVTLFSGLTGYVSDYREYATYFSADDVKLLYNAPISVTNNGSLMTQGEIVEE